MSYSMTRRRAALAGMDPMTCLSKGGLPMPTPVPWGTIDIDCQLPGEPPQAAACRSYGGMWYRELGICIPGMAAPPFPSTPYSPAPPANPYDQVAAQVCTLTGGRYANGICSYPQMGVTRTKAQLVDSEYEPPAGWAPPQGGCPSGQIGWPPACVTVPNLWSTSAPGAGTKSCPSGQVWDEQAGKCLDRAQVLPPGEEPPSGAEPSAQKKPLPSWVIPAAIVGASFLVVAVLVARQPVEMVENKGDPDQRLQRQIHEKVYSATGLANRAARQKALTKLQRAELYSQAGRLYADAADLARENKLPQTAAALDKEWERVGKKAAELRSQAYEWWPPGRAYGMVPNPTVRLGYDALNVFQRYWYGQWDPLYAMFSRRGNSVDWVTLEVSDEELDRFLDVAHEIVRSSKDPSEVRVAKRYIEELPATAWAR